MGKLDFVNRCFRFGHDKTAADTGRTVPLNQRAMNILRFWSQQFPSGLPEHYVFPSGKTGVAGNKFRRQSLRYTPDKACWNHQGGVGDGQETDPAPAPLFPLQDRHLG